MTRVAALAVILATLAATRAALADCDVAAAASCDKVGFEPNQMDRFGPNRPLHAVAQLVSVTQVGGGDPGIRGALGVGMLLGWSPFGTQVVRASLGGDVLFGEWAGHRLGGITLEPKLRIDVQYNKSLFAVGGFAQATAPWFAKDGTFGGGAGGGVSGSVLNRLILDLGYERFALPNDLTVPGDIRTSGGRFFLALGGDLVTIISSAEGIPPRSQAQVDLRCRTLAAAFSVKTTRTDPLCVQALGALAEVDIAKAEPGATDSFIGKLPALFQGALKVPHEDGRRCVAKQRADERLCRDCSKTKLATWYAYEIDARQILGALGCTENPAETMICDDAEARAAAAANCR